jgi:hypothetical protein
VRQKLFDVREEPARARFGVKEAADSSAVSVIFYQNTCARSQGTLISLIISKYFVISGYRRGVIKLFTRRGCYTGLIGS